MLLKYSEMFAHNSTLKGFTAHRHDYSIPVGHIHSGTAVRQCANCERWEAMRI